MTITLFAVLKEYFPPKIYILDESINNVEDVKKHLNYLNPEASKVLSSCRFAVNNQFINQTFIINNTDDVSVIPPSSGG